MLGKHLSRRSLRVVKQSVDSVEALVEGLSTEGIPHLPKPHLPATHQSLPKIFAVGDGLGISLSSAEKLFESSEK